MRGKVVKLALVGALVVATGCSKQGMVKNDEQVAPSATAAAAQAGAAKTANDQAAVKPALDNGVVAAVPVQAQPPVVVESRGGASAKGADAAANEIKKDLQRIYFSFDSYALTKEDRDILMQNLAVLKRMASVKVRIEGNCDERGSDDYNLALGEERAREAKKYLVTLGIPAERLSVISYGKEKPVDPGHDETAWAKNRRDDFVIQ